DCEIAPARLNRDPGPGHAQALLRAPLKGHDESRPVVRDGRACVLEAPLVLAAICFRHDRWTDSRHVESAGEQEFEDHSATAPRTRKGRRDARTSRPGTSINRGWRMALRATV